MCAPRGQEDSEALTVGGGDFVRKPRMLGIHGLNLPSHGFCDILLGTCASVLTKRFPSKLFFASSISDKFAGESRPPLDAGSGGELLLQLAQQPALGEREALQRLA